MNDNIEPREPISFESHPDNEKVIDQLYLKCEACGEVFEATEPQIARDHEATCNPGEWSTSPVGTYELQTEEEAF